MKLSTICFSLLFISVSHHINCQDNINVANVFDPDIYNGRIYNFGASRIDGHQFFESEEFSWEKVSIDKVTYDSLEMNYDIYNQEVLIKYESRFFKKTFSVPIELLREFTIRGHEFIVLNDEERNITIYELISDMDVVLLRKWSKDLQVSTDDDIYDYKFSNYEKLLYFYKSTRIERINGKRDFIEFFPVSGKKDIRRFIRKNRIRIRSASNTELKSLLHFCNTL